MSEGETPRGTTKIWNLVLIYPEYVQRWSDKNKISCNENFRDSCKLENYSRFHQSLKKYCSILWGELYTNISWFNLSHNDLKYMIPPLWVSWCKSYQLILTIEGRMLMTYSLRVILWVAVVPAWGPYQELVIPHSACHPRKHNMVTELGCTGILFQYKDVILLV